VGLKYGSGPAIDFNSSDVLSDGWLNFKLIWKKYSQKWSQINCYIIVRLKDIEGRNEIVPKIISFNACNLKMEKGKTFPPQTYYKRKPIKSK
jgi:hypothetical protein